MLWSEILLKSGMMETLGGFISGGGLVPWTYRKDLPFNLIFPAFSRWTAEDLAFSQISINPFLYQLSLAIQSIRSFGIPPFLG